MISLLDLGLLRVRRVPLVLQTELAECGLACLAMVTGYYGFDTDIMALRRRFTSPTRGTSLDEIARCADALGLTCRAVRVDLVDLGALKAPAILHWKMNHFVVLERTRGRKALIHDPAGRSEWFDYDEISRWFTGIALELTPSAGFQGGNFRHRLKISQLWSAADGLVRSAILVLALTVLLQIVALSLPYFSKLALDTAFANSDAQSLFWFTLTFMLLGLVHALLTLIRSAETLSAGSSLSYGLSVNLAHRLFRLPGSWFLSRHVGDITSRFQSLRPIRDTLTEDVVSGIIDGVFVFAAIFLISIYSTALAAWAVVSFLLLLALKIGFFYRQRPAKEAVIVHSARQQSTLIEIVQGIRTLRLSGRLYRRELFWRMKLARAINSEVVDQRLSNWAAALRVAIVNVDNVVFLAIALYLAIGGHLTLGSVFAAVAYKATFSMNSIALLDKAYDWRMLSLHLDRIADIALTPCDERYTDQAHGERQLKGHIQLEDVHFRYSEFDPAVLSGVSLEVRPGESLAITGPSGGGKTTLALIILGLLKPTQGRVLIDGMPLSEFGEANLERGVAAVLQDDTLFSGTILENITLFDEAADMARVEAVAKAAFIDHEIRKMPMSYLTLVGDMGGSLSGGQKQRILLSRALYQQPALLVLDEGTSHLDVDAETRVNKSVSALGITRVIIAHRESTINSADRVVELVDGVIRTHEDRF